MHFRKGTEEIQKVQKKFSGIMLQLVRVPYVRYTFWTDSTFFFFLQVELEVGKIHIVKENDTTVST